MIGRKAVVGLSLLCALCFCAFAASSASAANGTTAGECVSGGGNKDFEDAHCDIPKTPGTGAFGHVLFANGTAVNITGTNDTTGTTTPWMLEGKVAGILVTVDCDVSVTGTVTNSAGPPMSAAFGNAHVKYSNCKVTTQENKCTVTVTETNAKVSAPMNLKIGAEKEDPTGEKIKVVEEAAGSTEMGLKFVPNVEGGAFATLIFAGAECPAAIKGEKQVKGFAYGTSKGRAATEGTNSSGATLTFSKASTLGGLTFGGQPATLVATCTLRKEGGNPLILTTTAT